VTTLREIVAELGFEVDPDGMDEWEGRIREGVTTVTQAISGMGVAVVGTVAMVTQSLIGMGDDLGDVAARTGVSAQELSEWDHVATMSGASVEAMRGALARLPSIMGQVDSGSATMRRTFRDLGVSVEGADGQLRATGDVMGDVVGALSRIRNPTERAAAATRVFGRSGRELVGVLGQGEEGIAALRAEVRDLYGGSLPAFVEAASRADDAQNRLNLQMRAMGVVVGAEVLPVVADLLEQAVAGGRAFIDWARDTTVIRGAVIALTAVLAMAAAAGAVLALSTVEIWGPAALAMAAAAAVAASLGFAFDDIMTFLEGGDSLIGAFVTGIFGLEGAKGILESVRMLIAGIGADLEVLLGGATPDLRELVVGVLTQWVAQMAAIALGVLVVVRAMTWLSRTVSETWSSAWVSATATFETFLARVTSGLAEARHMVEGVAGFLGIDLSTGERGAGSNAGAAADATRGRVVEMAQTASTASSRTVSVGQIVVQGVSDAIGAAEAVQASVARMLTGEVDTAREDLVPEVE